MRVKTDVQNGGGSTSLSGEDLTMVQNTKFLDEVRGEILQWETRNNIIADDDYQPNIELGDFLSRPVNILNFTWLETDVVGTGSSFAPWSLFLDTLSIKNKLQNYPYIRGKLHLKMVINASPFYYGSILMNYLPCAGLNPSTIVSDSLNSQFIPSSQRPHVWIYPQSNQGGEIVCPFIYHYNWLKTANFSDVANFGGVTWTIVNQLQSANGALGVGVSVSVFAWMEDVQLYGTTSALILQSGDEYGKGPISKPALAIAAAMNRLKDVPVIGPYATASSMAAKTIGDISSAFGYTNVPNISNTASFKPSAFPHFASAEISTPIERLCLDPKNELTIDNSTIGVTNQDEMSLPYLLQRESYLTSFNMTTSNVMNDRIFSTWIVPRYYESDQSVSTNIVNMTPMSYLAYLFKYWRGDIIFRFKIVCTQYHKGRVMILYDPNNTAAMLGSVQSSTVYSQVVDIGSDTDIEFRVPYMQEKAWSLCPTTINNVKTFSNTGAALGTFAAGMNGNLIVRVLNVLTAPIATSSIQFQVFVRAADNFELALPMDTELGNTYFNLQTEDVVYENTSSIEVAAEQGSIIPQRYLYNMGEPFISLRQLLHRTFYIGSTGLVGDAASWFRLITSRAPRLPPYYGYDPNGFGVAKGTIVPLSDFRFNYTKNTPISWIVPMFLSYRGSVNHTVNIDSTPSTVGDLRMFYAPQRFRFTTTYDESVTLAAGVNNNAVTRFKAVNYSNFQSGGSLTHQQTQAGISVNIPYYSDTNFTYTNVSANNLGAFVDGSNKDTIQTQFTLKPAFSAKDAIATNFDRYFSIGPDFNLIFFLNVPSFRQLPTYPLSA